MVIVRRYRHGIFDEDCREVEAIEALEVAGISERIILCVCFRPHIH
jgi:hypothetical protein